jgi:hypothetical protein
MGWIHLRFVLPLLAAAALSPVAAAGDDFAIVERDGVRIESSLKAQVYSWKITNVSAETITRFEIVQNHAYSQSVPPGWEFTHENALFTAWATHPRFGIQRGQSALFTARGSSEGALLGLRPAIVGTLDGDHAVRFDAVWTPVSKPWTLVWLVIATMAALAVVHVWLIRQKPLHSGATTAR